MKAGIRRINPVDEYFSEEGCYILELSNSPQDPELSIARARVAPGATTRWHRLDETIERYVILQGVGCVEVGDLPPTEVCTGDVVLIPQMCPQRITNIGEEDLVFLAVCTPRFSNAAYQDINDFCEQHQEMKMLEKNQSAPEFRSRSQDENVVNLSDYRDGQNIVLYFYPRDDTSGCTIEARQFTELADEFGALDTVVIGVSRDSCESHQAFIDKYGLSVTLLADTSGELCEQYGVWQEKEKNGEKKMGIVRSTFIINKQGVLEDVMYGVTADGHARQILERVKQIQSK